MEIAIPPATVKEKLGDGVMLGLVAEEHAAVHQERPDVQQAGLERGAQVNIAKSKGSWFLETWKRLFEESLVEFANRDFAIARDVAAYLIKRSGPGASLIHVIYIPLYQPMPGIVFGWGRESFERIKHVQSALANLAGNGKYRSGAAFV